MSRETRTSFPSFEIDAAPAEGGDGGGVLPEAGSRGEAPGGGGPAVDRRGEASPSAGGPVGTSPSAGGPAFRLRGFLPHQLNVLANRTSEGFSAIYSAGFGLSVPEWRILATLGEQSPARAKDIEGTRHMHKTVVSRAVAALEERGLVGAVPNQNDKRERFLGLTEAGRRLYEEIVPLGLAFEDRFLAVLDGEERAQLARIMAKLMIRPEDAGR